MSGDPDNGNEIKYKFFYSVFIFHKLDIKFGLESKHHVHFRLLISIQNNYIPLIINLHLSFLTLSGDPDYLFLSNLNPSLILRSRDYYGRNGCAVK